MQKIFITSSGTGIGKTLITCSLAKALKKNKKKVHALKPVISGFKIKSVPNDLSLICKALEIPYTQENIDKINLYSFSKAMSPDMAARIEKSPEISFDKLKSFCEKPTNIKTDYLLIETVGGLMVPINSSKTFLELITSIESQVILVAGSYLGSLNHTLASYKLLKNNNKDPAAVIVTQNLDKKDQLYIPLKETIKSLENFITTPIIGVEKLSGNEETKISKLSKILTDERIITTLGN